ncbi:MAG: hypothetical protein M3322_08025 [Actinomycetota bacterium]|nr:hypothetical protein [Actinomycetota bacterium]
MEQQRGPSWAPWFAWREREPWPRGVPVALAAAAASLVLSIGSLFAALQANARADEVEGCAKRLATWIAQIQREAERGPVDARPRTRFLDECTRYIPEEYQAP